MPMCRSVCFNHKSYVWVASWIIVGGCLTEINGFQVLPVMNTHKEVLYVPWLTVKQIDPKLDLFFLLLVVSGSLLYSWQTRRATVAEFTRTDVVPHETRSEQDTR